MEKFNLTFKGEIVVGQDLAEVKVRFARALAIDDLDRVEPFFSGKTVTLRRDIDQDTAQAFYTRMYRVGIVLKMEPAPKKKAGASTTKTGMDRQFHHESPGRVDQSWPIRAVAPPAEKPQAEPDPAPTPLKKGNAVKQAEEQQRKKKKEETNHKAEEAARQQAKELAAEEKAAREAEEARIRKEEAERKAAEKAEQEKAAEEKAARAKAKKQRKKTEEAERKAAEEAARQKALEEAARKKAAEEKAARAKVEAQRKKAEEAERKAAEEAARQKSLEEAARKKSLEEAARKKAAEEKAAQAKAEEQRKKAEEAERKAAEEVARQKALKEEAKRKAAEEAARQKALKEEAKRKAAEEAARQKALKEAARKKAAEEAARAKAEEQRRKAEEAARAKALEEEAKRKAAEEAALQKALEEAARKRADEEAARKKAAEEAALAKAEEQRRKAEEVARAKALEEEAKRKAAEEAARKKAAEEAARAKAEEQRRKAEEAARAKALEEEVKRKAAEEAALQKALEEAARKRAAEAEAERIAAAKAELANAEEQRIKAELLAVAAVQKADEAARKLALQEEEKRRALDEVERLRSKEQALAQAVLEEAPAKQKTQQPSPGPVAETVKEPSAEPVKKPSAEPVKKPSVEPARKPSAEPISQLPDKPRKRQAGAPNLFSLRPFRNTDDIRQRSEKSKRLMKTMFIISAAALLVLTVLGARYYLLPPLQSTISGASAIAVDQQDGLVIVAGTRLYTLDRSGVAERNYPLNELGIHSRINLLGFDAAGTLVLQHQVAGAAVPDANTPAASQWQTLGCDLKNAGCNPYFQDLPGERISGWVVDFRTGNIYLTIPATGLLMKFSRDGTLSGQIGINLPEQSQLRLRGGLLLMNSATGPGISIIRPDNKDFGQQLDEVLLLPPPAVEKEQTRVADFIWSSGNWWVKMINPDTRQADIYRFDPNWNFLSSVVLKVDSYPGQLLDWAGKVLVLDSRQLPIQRFNSDGQAEAPLIPGELQSTIEVEQLTTAQSQKLWHTSLGILALVVIGSLLLGRLYQLRSLVYKSDKVRGAEPIDDKEKLIHWVDPVGNRSAYYKKTSITYILLSLSILGILFGLGVPLTVMLATALLLTGPVVILALLWPSKPGHIGILGNQLILVDQHSMYHMGSGPRIYYRDNFLIMDDIVVFLGTRALPVFSAEQLAEHIVPRALAGIKIDRKTVIIKLLQSGHPLAKGMLASIACAVAAIICLLFF